MRFMLTQDETQTTSTQQTFPSNIRMTSTSNDTSRGATASIRWQTEIDQSSMATNASAISVYDNITSPDMVTSGSLVMAGINVSPHVTSINDISTVNISQSSTNMIHNMVASSSSVSLISTTNPLLRVDSINTIQSTISTNSHTNSKSYTVTYPNTVTTMNLVTHQGTGVSSTVLQSRK